MKLNKYAILMLVAVIALSFASCGGKKTAATAAVKAAEDAFMAAQTELVKILPDETKAVADTLAAAKDNLTNGKYAAALASAKMIPDKVKELTALATTKKDELSKSWTEMSGGLPGMLESIKSRLDVLAKAKKLPAGLDKTALEGAKAGYETANTTWTEAQADFTGGNLANAVMKAKTVQEKAVEIMNALGMKPPAAATGA